MKELSPSKQSVDNCCSDNSRTSCCTTPDGSDATCCNPENTSWSKFKLLISVIIILVAVTLGVNSFFNGNSVQSYTLTPAKSFTAGLRKIPITGVQNSPRSSQQTKIGEISPNQVLDSLEGLDKLAADKDVVFLILPGETLSSPIEAPRQIKNVANNLWKSGQKIGIFTLLNSSADHNKLVVQFSVATFPSVVVISRQGTAIAVTGEITEARLYNAFILVSKPVACCPAQSNPSCCPK